MLRGFEEASLPAGTFHHREHVRAAGLYLRRERPGLALERFAADLRRLAAAYGKPDLYHATVTGAWLPLIGERVGRSQAADSERFVEERLLRRTIPRLRRASSLLASSTYCRVRLRCSSLRVPVSAAVSCAARRRLMNNPG